MWCQNCGNERAHYHRMGAANAEYCQRCRIRGRKVHTYCRYCGKQRSLKSSECDVHPGNGSGGDDSSDDASLPPDTPPAYSPATPDSDDDNYGTDAGSTDLDSPPRSPSTASLESDAQECSFCKMNFPSETEKNDHQARNNSGCWEHQDCFPDRENYQHAKEQRHTRCFVPGCKCKYADDLDWKDREIERHVKAAHM